MVLFSIDIANPFHVKLELLTLMRQKTKKKMSN